MKYWDRSKLGLTYEYKLRKGVFNPPPTVEQMDYSVVIYMFDDGTQEVHTSGDERIGVPLPAWRELIADIVETLYS